MAFASPALDFGFGRLPQVVGVVREIAARWQSIGAMIARRLQPFAAKSAAVFAWPAAQMTGISPPRSERTVPRPMTLADQWSKISAVLVRSVDGARVATEMQSAATQQLDLAQYGLLTLVDELSAVMTIPGRRSRSATVHAFNSTFENSDMSSANGQALAA